MSDTGEKILSTPFSETMGEIPWNVYPRPQLRRDSFLCLNGKWDLVVEGPEKNEDLGTILVPFPPESALSGIGRRTGREETLVYSRTFSLPEGFDRGRVFLHFGAADQKAEVLLNGTFLAAHDGGYLPFSAEATGHLLEGENRLTVRVRDPMDPAEGLGKQREKRGGIWYTPFSGLWQTVWAESVPETYIEKIRLTPWYDKVTIEVLGEGTESLEKVLRVKTETGEDARTFTGTSLEYVPRYPHAWTPEDPYLYEFSVEIPGDRIESYFGLRSVTIGTPSEGLHAHIARMFLNGAPTFYHGVLDQGYYSDGIVLPATPEGYLSDIRHMKAMGFNTLRKHIKIEPELFYYYCDREGMVVFQDLVNSGEYRRFEDSVLPLLGVRKGLSGKADETRKANFLRDLKATIDHLYNHPGLLVFTVFNEGWGQFDTDALYEAAREADPTRPIDTASGWFDDGKSDFCSVHEYFRNVGETLEKARDSRCQVLSECGGFALKVPGHVYNEDKEFGYRICRSGEELEEKILALYRDHVLPQIRKGLTGCVYTQLSDVEDELNGLLTYDRRVVKVDPGRMREIAEKIGAIINLREHDTQKAVDGVLEPGGVLLLGDSITDMYETNVSLSEFKVFNRGFSGDRSDQMLWKLPRTLGVLRPDTVVILIGSNDIGHGFTEEMLEANLRKTAEVLRERVPGASVHLITPLPTNPDAKKDHPKHEFFTSVRPNDKILSMVERQAKIARDLGWAYHDFASSFKDGEGRLREDLTIEGLHLNAEGYKIYTSLLLPILRGEKA